MLVDKVFHTMTADPNLHAGTQPFSCGQRVSNGSFPARGDCQHVYPRVTTRKPLHLCNPCGFFHKAVLGFSLLKGNYRRALNPVFLNPGF